jgi:NADH dehydrogenase
VHEGFETPKVAGLGGPQVSYCSRMKQIHMASNYKIATVFGGTGFIGRQVVRELARAGYTVKVATRVPARAYFLRPCGVVGQIVPFPCDYRDSASIRTAVEGAAVVVNCIGILYEKKKGDFIRLHADLPAAIAGACAGAGVERLVHISALGLEQDKSRYARTKLEGEKSVLKAFPAATILRPSVVFGPDDEFFNKFARLSLVLPVLPLIGGGRTKFQPVYVGDIADAVIASLDENKAAAGKIYELGGPEALSFEQIYERLFSYTLQKRPLVALPWALAKIKAFFFGLLPGAPLLTMDQVESLKADHVASSHALQFQDLGLKATALDVVLPRYLVRYRRGGRFGAARYS